jgi:hypothetical protein
LTVENKNGHVDLQGMSSKRPSKQQQQLNVDQFKLLKKQMDQLGKQINVPGSFWQDHMLPDERDKVYMCTIIDFSLTHKFAPDSSPRMASKCRRWALMARAATSRVTLRAQCTGLLPDALPPLLL